MEITQVIQALDNSVRLIAGKPTVVRVYLDPAVLGDATLVTGEMTWRRGSGGASYLPAMNRVRLDPVRTPDVQGQRFSLTESLNFRLPEEAVGAGDLELQLNRIQVPGGEKLPLTSQPMTTVNFKSTPPLRVRVIGLRYKSVHNPPAIVTPDALHFAYLRSYFRRAYPVAALEWSQIVIDGDNLVPLPPPSTEFPEAQSILVNAQLSALRSSEVSAGVDSRTHYYGLVERDKGGSFMRGSAVYNETTKIFGLVACGPCGVPKGWTGDFDESFADWYGAHELGHTFQRRHPGFPKNVQPKDDLEQTWPYEDGRISTPDQKFIGFDVGDPELGLPMSVLRGDIYHDVMTYADSQWLSAYTYEAIHDRLIYEDTALALSVG
jgi:hypothetical protein